MKQSNPEKNEIRLNRFLAMAGVGSRRGCDKLIQDGRVKVNGEVITQMGVRINPERDKVLFDNQPVQRREQFAYLLLNKPPRTVTTTRDDRNRRTVIELLGLSERLFPVGRLDYNTTGAILLTNDGDLSYHLIHPKFKIKKVYRVMINKLIRPIDLHHFNNGLILDGRKTAPCKAREMRRIGNCSYLEVELYEGRNRQIRRMFEVLGYHVEELERVEFAGLSIAGLKQGEWRELETEEVDRLKKLIERQKAELEV